MLCYVILGSVIRICGICISANIKDSEFYKMMYSVI